ncbi:hypothetical protein [Staphylococcus intermedius]|uniref:Uncharacterized protein n=1 Tax=Staphylococcus intermedius NCTC 11048 TaxID=1141106 RepID=A0A380G8S4_STAIN|nr:hypothetical protein [Staphylococcus intermedius]PCF64584.1 hypothetical protein B5C04_00645 [Staphylococcus intermedius]PCF80194.1 hypothetical protein B4W74_00660 [Staphylococcus intermedius]PCF81544.1 hypothetical protein B4W70_00645 [Staphylococcus intermedius]PCF84304.1 hypothetical protein B4W76_11700 [Staphylococcus intermedius]PCF86411.1 hypothetical protein B4W75_10675 [Staphylococcus intermedius]
MNYQEISNILENSDVKEVVKAIFAYETGEKDESCLNYLTNHYFESEMESLLDWEIRELQTEWNWQRAVNKQ